MIKIIYVFGNISVSKEYKIGRKNVWGKLLR
jgi:hypothetical protein